MFGMLIRLPFSSTLRKRLRILKFNERMISKFFGKDYKNKEQVIRNFNEYDKEVYNSIPKKGFLCMMSRVGGSHFANS